MDVGTRVRLARPGYMQDTARGEVVENGESRSATRGSTEPAVLVKWDKHDQPVWYLPGDLVTVDW